MSKDYPNAPNRSKMKTFTHTDQETFDAMAEHFYGSPVGDRRQDPERGLADLSALRETSQDTLRKK